MNDSQKLRRFSIRILHTTGMCAGKKGTFSVLARDVAHAEEIAAICWRGAVILGPAGKFR